MNQNSQLKRLLLIGIPLVLLLVISFLWLSLKGQPQKPGNGVISVSLDSGFYNGEQLITVEAPAGAVVYYTDNCAKPDKENGMEYAEPILLTIPEEEEVRVYRFRAYYEDGTESEVVSRTYFCGRRINSRYTTNVLHLAGDPEDLFGYEKGIFVTGKIFDEYLKEHPGDFFRSGVDANFTQRGPESEREVYIEYFDRDGKALMAQNCGVRIYGAMSRLKNQKSFRLYARKEYDEQNEFNYPVISALVSSVDGTIASRHKRLVVRNAGNDNGFGFIRSELTARLASQAGFPDVMHAEPVCVYINGIYYGIYWMENGFDDQYFVNRYGEHDGEFVVLEGGDDEKLADEDAHVQSYVEEYNRRYQEFAEMDLTLEENYRKLQEFLDVENYLQYFAIENYVGNEDWPGNNVRAYRYVSPDGTYQEGTVFDGRYRHMLFDIDYAFGILLYNETIGTYPEKMVLAELIEEESPLFAALMERQDCRDYFASYTCDLFNGAMSYENVEKTLDEMHASRMYELYHMLEETDIMEVFLWNWEDHITMDYANVEKNYQTILDYADIHADVAWSDVTRELGYSYSDWYKLNVCKRNRSNIKINTITMTEAAFSGKYFSSIPVVLTPIMDVNEEFDYWLVNDEIRTERELKLTTEDVVEGCANVELVVHESDNPILRIQTIRAKGQYDYIELVNISDKEISTRGYYLSDREDAYRYALPTAVLAPGESVRYYGHDSMDPEALGKNGLNFNIKAGETITLTCREKVLQTVSVPDLMLNGLYQWDAAADRFVEVLMEEED